MCSTCLTAASWDLCPRLPSLWTGTNTPYPPKTMSYRWGFNFQYSSPSLIRTPLIRNFSPFEWKLNLSPFKLYRFTNPKISQIWTASGHRLFGWSEGLLYPQLLRMFIKECTLCKSHQNHVEMYTSWLKVYGWKCSYNHTNTPALLLGTACIEAWKGGVGRVKLKVSDHMWMYKCNTSYYKHNKSAL